MGCNTRYSDALARQLGRIGGLGTPMHAQNSPPSAVPQSVVSVTKVVTSLTTVDEIWSCDYDTSHMSPYNDEAPLIFIRSDGYVPLFAFTTDFGRLAQCDGGCLVGMAAGALAAELALDVGQ